MASRALGHWGYVRDEILKSVNGFKSDAVCKMLRSMGAIRAFSKFIV